MKEIEKISIIGTGNVAHQLGRAFVKNNFKIDGVWGRTDSKSKALAKDLSSNWIEKIENIPTDTDLVLVCVSDDAILEVVENIPEHLSIAYTSGSVLLNSLPKRKEIGVFYPLQTFTKSRELSFDDIPILIESENKQFAGLLEKCAIRLSKTVRYTSSEERHKIHIAAVMVNNFTNHIYHLANLYMDKEHLPFDILKPLILETAEKIQKMSPSEAQTGPAKRNDQNVIKKHLSELNDETKSIYKLLSESILKHNQ